MQYVHILYILSRIQSLYLLLFYNAYILPHFDWCCIVLGNCNTALEDTLVRFQKRAAILILHLDCLTHALLFNILTWMAFPERIVYQKALQMYTNVHCYAPDYLTPIVYDYFWNPYTATSVFLNISFVHTQTKTWTIPPFIYIYRGFYLELSPC